MIVTDNKKRKMPSVKLIKQEWENKFRFIEDFGWKELPTNACWRCGETGKMDRAHIWSRSDMLCHTNKTNEEIDSPSNLHLLCSSCHKYSEFISGWAPGLAYYEWFYTLREDKFNVPALPQIWNENRFYAMMVVNVFAKELGIDMTNGDRNTTDEELEKIKKWSSAFYECGYKTGKTILHKDRYKKYLTLPKDDKELACFDPVCFNI